MHKGDYQELRGPGTPRVSERSDGNTTKATSTSPATGKPRGYASRAHLSRKLRQLGSAATQTPRAQMRSPGPNEYSTASAVTSHRSGVGPAAPQPSSPPPAHVQPLVPPVPAPPRPLSITAKLSGPLSPKSSPRSPRDSASSSLSPPRRLIKHPLPPAWELPVPQHRRQSRSQHSSPTRPHSANTPQAQLRPFHSPQPAGPSAPTVYTGHPYSHPPRLITSKLRPPTSHVQLPWPEQVPAAGGLPSNLQSQLHHTSRPVHPSASPSQQVTPHPSHLPHTSAGSAAGGQVPSPKSLTSATSVPQPASPRLSTSTAPPRASAPGNQGLLSEASSLRGWMVTDCNPSTLSTSTSTRLAPNFSMLSSAPSQSFSYPANQAPPDLTFFPTAAGNMETGQPHLNPMHQSLVLPVPQRPSQPGVGGPSEVCYPQTYTNLAYSYDFTAGGTASDTFDLNNCLQLLQHTQHALKEAFTQLSDGQRHKQSGAGLSTSGTQAPAASAVSTASLEQLTSALQASQDRELSTRAQVLQLIDDNLQLVDCIEALQTELTQQHQQESIRHIAAMRLQLAQFQRDPQHPPATSTTSAVQLPLPQLPGTQHSAGSTSMSGPQPAAEAELLSAPHSSALPPALHAHSYNQSMALITQDNTSTHRLLQPTSVALEHVVKGTQHQLEAQQRLTGHSAPTVRATIELQPGAGGRPAADHAAAATGANDRVRAVAAELLQLAEDSYAEAVHGPVASARGPPQTADRTHPQTPSMFASTPASTERQSSNQHASSGDQMQLPSTTGSQQQSALPGTTGVLPVQSPAQHAEGQSAGLPGYPDPRQPTMRVEHARITMTSLMDADLRQTMDQPLPGLPNASEQHLLPDCLPQGTRTGRHDSAPAASAQQQVEAPAMDPVRMQLSPSWPPPADATAEFKLSAIKAHLATLHHLVTLHRLQAPPLATLQGIHTPTEHPSGDSSPEVTPRQHHTAQPSGQGQGPTTLPASPAAVTASSVAVPEGPAPTKQWQVSQDTVLFGGRCTDEHSAMGSHSPSRHQLPDLLPPPCDPPAAPDSPTSPATTPRPQHRPHHPFLTASKSARYADTDTSDADSSPELQQHHTQRTGRADSPSHAPVTATDVDSSGSSHVSLPALPHFLDEPPSPNQTQGHSPSALHTLPGSLATWATAATPGPMLVPPTQPAMAHTPDPSWAPLRPRGSQDTQPIQHQESWRIQAHRHTPLGLRSSLSLQPHKSVLQQLGAGNSVGAPWAGAMHSPRTMQQLQVASFCVSLAISSSWACSSPDQAFASSAHRSQPRQPDSPTPTGQQGTVVGTENECAPAGRQAPAAVRASLRASRLWPSRTAYARLAKGLALGAATAAAVQLVLLTLDKLLLRRRKQRSGRSRVVGQMCEAVQPHGGVKSTSRRGAGSCRATQSPVF